MIRLSHVLFVGLLAIPTGPASAAAPPPLAAPGERADRIVVHKHRRQMELWRGTEVLRTYRIRLGDAPVGHKQRQGDERTPEGHYLISGRNPRSRFHLSLRVSYPTQAHRRSARARGVDPGGDIMIHGGSLPASTYDWTDGCIAVTNREMEEIWSLVATGTRIRILP